jgi:hypothetical protein
MNNKTLLEKKFLTSMLAYSIIVSLPAIFLFSVGIYTKSTKHLIVWGGFLALTWIIFFGVKLKYKVCFWISLIISTIAWVLLLAQAVIRIQFVLENGGMDRKDGYGSPVAFLLGLVGEQLFFVPLIFVVYYGWRSCFAKPTPPDVSHG